MTRLTLGSLVFSLSALALGACAVDGTSSDEAYSTDSCDGAAVDSYGYCRARSGQFAKSSCCAPADACDTATIDEHGICRRADNGQFAPVACCDALCAGAGMDDHGYCRLPNGRFALSACCGDACVDQADNPACHPPVDSEGIAAAVDELEEIFVDGRGGFQRVSTSEPLAMIKEYLEIYYEDPELTEEYTYVENADAMVADEPIAGTLKLQAALDEAVGQLEWMYEYWLEPPEIAELQDRATRAIQNLAAAGAVLGFDGYDQNYCAAPTYMLLVLDTEEQLVEAVDLSPCRE